MQYPLHPPRWLWFTVVAGLAVFASLMLAASHEPPLSLPELFAAHGDPAASAATPALLDPWPAFDKLCLLCQQPLY